MNSPTVGYWELARVFVRLSMTAFGGPVAHIAIAENELVTRQRWLTREHYLDLVSAANLIPGPNSTEVMIHVGYVMRGIPGAIVAGTCFIIPAMAITLALVTLYVASGALPQAAALLWGIQPVIVAIIAVAAYRLFPSALKDRALWALLVAGVLALAFTDVPEVLVMLGSGVLYAAYKTGVGRVSAALLALPVLQTVVEVTRAPASLWDIFWYFLRIGSVLFGSGYVLIAYIQQDIVNTFGWLSARELLDMVAIGQFTPGPVLTTVTAVGYLVAGLPGALVGTFGVFLPSFVFVILTAPLIPKMRRSAVLSAFLSGVNAGVIAAILITVAQLSSTALRTLDGAAISVVAIALAVLTAIALVRFRLNATWLVLAGAVVGLLTNGAV